MERIVSNDQVTAWFDEGHDEWVRVVHGEATLEIGDGRHETLGPGVSLMFPPTVRHRVVRSVRHGLDRALTSRPKARAD